MRAKTILIAMSLTTTIAQAAEYSVTPFGSLRTEGDTNRRLTVADSDNTYGGVFEIGALFNGANDKTSVSFTPRLAIDRYSDDGTGFDQDSENYYFDLTASHRINEQFFVGIGLGYANVGVAATELEDIGIVINDGNNFSSGGVNVNQNFSRESFSVNPSITWVFSEKSSFTFGAGYTDATYDRQDTGLSDYENSSINFTWNRQLSEKNTFVATVFASNYKQDLDFNVRTSSGTEINPLLITDESDQLGFTLGFERIFSDTLSGQVNVGMRNTEGDFPDLFDFDYQLSEESSALLRPGTATPIGNVINRLDPILINDVFLRENRNFFRNSRIVNRDYRQGSTDNTGLVLDASLEKDFEKTTLIGGLSTGTTPTGRGLVDRSEAYVTALHRYSDRLNLNSSFRYFTTESENEGTLAGNNNETQQIRFELGLNWRMTEFWTISGGYDYGRRMSDFSESADNHGFYLTTGYNGNRFAISR